MTAFNLADRRARLGIDPDLPTSGPIADVMTRAGFGPDHLRRTASFFDGMVDTGIVADGFVGAAASLRAAADAFDGDDFTVDVDFTDRSVADGAFVTVTRRVVVRADGPADATLAAAALVGALRADIDGMVTATRIVAVAV